MKTPFSRFVLCLIVSCLFYITNNQTVAAPLSTVEDFCGVVDYKPDNRNYARSMTANLNVGEPRTVRMIYFLPNDRPYRAEVVQRMKDEILNIQTFYAEAMQAHGYQDMTFKIETDAQGEPVVHRADGLHPDSYYVDDTLDIILNETGTVRDISQTIYFIVIDNSTNKIGMRNGSRVQGIGGRVSKNGGIMIVPDEFSFTTGAHELGHAFGLQHDFRDETYIMSYGRGPTQLSVCNADFLAVHPYFNPDIPTDSGGYPTIKFISPTTYPTGSQSVSIQLKINDLDGLHQVILFVKTVGPLLPNDFLEIKACRKLTGEKEAIIEFEYDGGIPSSTFTSLATFTEHPITIEVIDINGDVRYRHFTLSEILPEQPPPIPKTLVKISGDNQEGTAGIAFPNLLVVEVRGLNHNPLSDIQVNFIVSSGNGKLNGLFTTENVMTSNLGQAHTRLTPGMGSNTVEVSVNKGNSVVFHAIGINTGIGDSTRAISNYQTWGLLDGVRIRFGKGGVSGADKAVVFSHDGQYLAVTSDIGIWLYNAITYQELALFPSSRGVDSIAFSPDGTLLASGERDNAVKLWDVTTRQNIATFRHNPVVKSVIFSLDGKAVAFGSGDRSIKLWEISSEQIITTFDGHIKTPNSVVFSPDGTLLASGGEDGMVKLWDVATAQNIATFEHKSKVNTVVFSPDGKTLASGSYDATLKLWDIVTGIELLTIQERRSINAIAFSPDGKTLAWDSTNIVTHVKTIKLWEMETGQPSPTTITKFSDYVFGIKSIAFSPDGRSLVSASHGDGVVKVWDVETGNTVDLGHIRINPSTISFSPDSTILALGAYDGTIKLWDVATGQNIGNLLGVRESWVRVVAFSSDGKTIASRASREQGIRLWDVDTQTMIVKLEGHKGVTALTFSPDGQILLSGGSDDAIKLWDMETRQNIATFEGHTGIISSISCSPDGKIIASASNDKTVKLWDVVTEQNIATLMDEGQVESAMFSFDGTMLASSTLKTVKLWDVATQNLITTFKKLTSDYQKIGNRIYSPNGEFILIDFGSTISLWDTSTQTLITTFQGYSPDGKTFASRTYSNVVLLGDSDIIEKRVSAPTDFFLSLKRNDNFIHIPLKVTAVNGVVKTIESIVDFYDALGGKSYIVKLETFDPFTKRWITHIKRGKDSTVDLRLTDNTVIKARMSSNITIALQGDALGTNGHSTIILHPGKNLVGIPLKDSRLKKVSDLLSLDGIRDNVTHIDIPIGGGEYKSVTGADDPDDIPITGGQAFELYARTEATVDIYGEKWTNDRSVIAAPSIASPNVEVINRIKTSLLPNYPNPFNPETWIPYRLAKDADVMLTIYDVSGKEVRSLDIGHSKAGIYESRNKAIYWDGRNDLGESVASGVYFYHLKAGEYSATKRMVILK